MILNENIRILIISDSHGNLNNVMQVLKKEKNINIIFHLGDTIQDAISIMETFNDLELYYVAGNHDNIQMQPKEKFIELLGWKIFITHGHIYNVKRSFDKIIAKSKELQTDITIFGHNHIQKCIRHNGIIYINPGSISEPRGNEAYEFSYSILELNKDEVIVKSCWLMSDSSLNPIGLESGTVRLSRHNPEWEKIYLKERDLLLSAIGSSIIDIQHVGSTSIKGLKAKPIIDIAVAVESLQQGFELIEQLKSIGYIYKGDAGVSGRHFFSKGNTKSKTHYLHVCELNNDVWLHLILFRDYLRANKKIMKEYEQLKQELAVTFSDNREAYLLGKRKYIDDIVNKVKGELSEKHYEDNPKKKS